MKKAILEGWAGGRCYSEQEDGAECPWGQVTVWEPPHRLLLEWRINGAPVVIVLAGATAALPEAQAL